MDETGGGCPLCGQWNWHVLHWFSECFKRFYIFTHPFSYLCVYWLILLCLCKYIYIYICRLQLTSGWWEIVFGARVQFPLKLYILLHKWAPKPIHLNRYDPKLYFCLGLAGKSFTEFSYIFLIVGALCAPTLR